jgi:peroxiredoxin
MTRFAVLVFCLALALNAQSVFTGRRAPGFSLPDTKQKQHDLADYRGRVVVIDFMRTDCPKCREVTASLEQIKAKYGNDVQVLSVVTMPDNFAAVQKYVAANKVTSPILFDCGQMMASYLNITPQNPTVHLPHVIVVDKAGMIRRELKSEAVNTAALIGAIEAVAK